MQLRRGSNNGALRCASASYRRVRRRFVLKERNERPAIQNLGGHIQFKSDSTPALSPIEAVKLAGKNTCATRIANGCRVCSLARAPEPGVKRCQRVPKRKCAASSRTCF